MHSLHMKCLVHSGERFVHVLCRVRCCCVLQQTGGGAPSRRELLSGFLGAALGVGATTAYFKGEQQLHSQRAQQLNSLLDVHGSSWRAVLAGTVAGRVLAAGAPGACNASSGSDGSNVSNGSG